MVSRVQPLIIAVVDVVNIQEARNWYGLVRSLKIVDSCLVPLFQSAFYRFGRFLNLKLTMFGFQSFVTHSELGAICARIGWTSTADQLGSPTQ